MKKTAALTIIICALLWPGLAGGETQSEPALSEAPAPGTAVLPPPRVPANIRLLEQGYFYYRAGKLKEAEQAYTQLIRVRGLSRSQRATVYLLRGEARRDLSRDDDALADFTRALRQWPNYPQALFFRAQVYESQGLLVEALADFSRAAELSPDRDDYQNRLTLLKKKMAIRGWVIQEDQPPLPLDGQGTPPEPDDDLE